MVDATGTRAAAEFMVEGEYLATDAGLPPARGQRYRLPAGAFFDDRGRADHAGDHPLQPAGLDPAGRVTGPS